MKVTSPATTAAMQEPITRVYDNAGNPHLPLE
jgi:hypothetical protein